MLNFNQIRTLSGKAVTLSFTMWMCAACSSTRADTVFDNITTQVANGGTNGVSIGASILDGATALSLTDVIFPQLGAGTDKYVAGETFSIYTRNADGTVGTPLFSSFTLANDLTSGQTNALPTSPVVLLPNTGYWLIVSAATSTAWTYTLGTDYTSMLGVTLPVDHDTYRVANGTTTYFSLSDGPQLLRVDAMATTVPPVPEPSSWCLLALLGGSLFYFFRRGVVHLKIAS